MKKYKLKQLVDIKRGMSLSGEYYSTNGELIRLTLGNFQEKGGFKINTSKDDIYYTGPVKEEFILSEGDIITPLTEQVIGLLGSTARIPESGKYVQSGDIALVKSFSNAIDYDFCYYLISSSLVRRQLSAAAQQTKIRHTSPEKIMDCVVFLPEVKVQKKIAKLLDDINKKIELNNKINDNLQHQLKLMYDYWFTQFDFPDENGKPYRASGGSMVWNDELKCSIPKNWSVTTIGEITECHDSKRIPVSNVEREQMKGNIPYYGATGIMGYVNKAIFSGDYVLLAEDGSVMDKKGNPIVQRVSGDVWINNHAHVLEPKGKYSCRLLMMILKKIPVANIKTGSIQLKINQDNLNSFKILSIPDRIIDKINQIFIPIDQQLISIQKENEQLSALRDWLLPMLMNGQATITD